MSVQLYSLNNCERTQIERGDLKLRLICRENVPYPSAHRAARLRTSFERARASRKNGQRRLRDPAFGSPTLEASDLDHALAAVPPRQQSDQRLRRVFEAVDHVLLDLQLAVFDP